MYWLIINAYVKVAALFQNCSVNADCMSGRCDVNSKKCDGTYLLLVYLISRQL